MNYKNNNFYIEKIKADNLIKKYGSPIYCYSNKRLVDNCLLYTSPSPRDRQKSRMPSSA